MIYKSHLASGSCDLRAGGSCHPLDRAEGVLSSLGFPGRFGDEDGALVQRWCTALEECSHSTACEELRLAAARSLQTAGAAVVWRSLRAACPVLVPVALR